MTVLTVAWFSCPRWVPLNDKIFFDHLWILRERERSRGTTHGRMDHPGSYEKGMDGHGWVRGGTRIRPVRPESEHVYSCMKSRSVHHEPLGVSVVIHLTSTWFRPGWTWVIYWHIISAMVGRVGVRWDKMWVKHARAVNVLSGVERGIRRRRRRGPAWRLRAVGTLPPFSWLPSWVFTLHSITVHHSLFFTLPTVLSLDRDLEVVDLESIGTRGRGFPGTKWKNLRVLTKQIHMQSPVRSEINRAESRVQRKITSQWTLRPAPPCMWISIKSGMNRIARHEIWSEQAISSLWMFYLVLCFFNMV